MMVRLVLLAALVVSAMSLVTAQQRARKVYIELERAKTETRQLNQDWAQLQLAQTDAAKHATIDAVARRQLGMRPVTPDRAQYLTPSLQASSGGGQ